LRDETERRTAPSRLLVQRSRLSFSLQKVGADVTVVLQTPHGEPDGVTSKMKHSFRCIQLPPVPEECFAPFSAALVLQLYTYWKAIAAKTNPDEFRADDPLYKDAESEICGL
jgi:hypothetical protein